MTTALLGFVLAFAESGLGLGAFFPGEVAISSLATRADGPFAVLLLGATVALGATAGDHLGLLIGRLGGTRMRESRLVGRIGTGRWDRASELIQTYGFWAVLASRLLPFVRTVMPVVAGSAGLRYRSFAAASVIGAVGWSALWVGAGAGIAASGVLGRPWFLAVAVIAIVTGLAVQRLVSSRKKGRQQRADRAASDRATPGTGPVDEIVEVPDRHERARADTPC